MDKIVGRDKEKAILEEVFNSPEAELVAIYGRRRVGKTHLIREFFRDRGFYFQLTGVLKGSLQDQLFNLREEISKHFYNGEPFSSHPNTWMEAFALLTRELEKLNTKEKIILFFDEFPWLATKKSRFLAAFEHFWNQHMSTRSNVIVVICGSAASWMIKNVVNNKGGLYGRITRRIRLLPLTLTSTEKLLNSRGVQLDRKQIVELYMSMGGIPQYLKYAKKGQSATQIINEVCFSSQGALTDEFSNLFRSLFNNFEVHVSIVRALASKLSGMTKDELLLATNLKSGGTSSKIIKELEESGFIRYNPPFGKGKKKGKYQLIDEYSLFYLTWIENVPKSTLESMNSQHWLLQSQSQRWKSWSGFAFEMICIKHVSKIKQSLGISGIQTIESGWFSKGKDSAQIDLVIDRADQCINLCEIKFCKGEFEINENYAKALNNKKYIFETQTKTKKTTFTTLITPYGVKVNAHFLGSVQNQITLNELF